MCKAFNFVFLPYINGIYDHFIKQLLEIEKLDWFYI